MRSFGVASRPWHWGSYCFLPTDLVADKCRVVQLLIVWSDHWKRQSVYLRTNKASPNNLPTTSHVHGCHIPSVQATYDMSMIYTLLDVLRGMHLCFVQGYLSFTHDDVIKWKHFPCYWSFVRGIHQSPVNSSHKGQWRGALMLSLTYARIYGWVNNG